MRLFTIPLVALSLTAAAGTAVSQQDTGTSLKSPNSPTNQQTPEQKQPTEPDPGRQVLQLEALIDRQSVDATFGRKTVATAGIKWSCEPPRQQDPVRCTASTAPQHFSVSTCRQLAARLGPVTAFRGGGKVLGGTELKRCNTGVQHAGLPGEGGDDGGSGFVPTDDDAPVPGGGIDPSAIPDDIGTPDIPTPDLPPVASLACDGPDLSIVEVELRFPEDGRDPDGDSATVNYTVWVTVQNVGSSAWHSGEDQQDITMQEVGAGGGRDQIAFVDTFADLDVGEGHYALARNGSWREGSTEFTEPPDGYDTALMYDPDIYIDGNPENDDCNTDNNDFVVTSEQVMAAIESGDDTVIFTR